MIRSGYVLAGCETLASIVNNFILNKKDRYDNNFSREDISLFLSRTCSGFLHSFGQNFTGRSNLSKHVESERRVFEQCRDTKLFDQSNFIVDSGGFQASIGRLEKNETEQLIDFYHLFLREHHDVFDRAFILDLPPGPGCKLFDSFDDVLEINKRTYNIAKELPQEVRDKVVYINHFRTPRLWDIYSQILNEPGMFEAFKHYATGGIVANMSSDAAIPVIIYVLPLIPLLNQTKKHNRNHLDFHILGGANFRDILFYELFRLHVQTIHHIDLNITYDSSGLFKGLMIGRFIVVPDSHGTLKKVDLRSKSLYNRFENDKRIIDVFGECLNGVAQRNNFKEIQVDEIYDETTFYEEIKVYAMFYMLEQFALVQTQMRDVAIEIYPYYAEGDLEKFTTEIVNVTRHLNNGKLTRKQKAKAYSVSRSLDMLTSLDETYCKYLVTKFLSKDEFIELDTSTQILTC